MYDVCLGGRNFNETNIYYIYNICYYIYLYVHGNIITGIHYVMTHTTIYKVNEKKSLHYNLFLTKVKQRIYNSIEVYSILF